MLIRGCWCSAWRRAAARGPVPSGSRSSGGLASLLPAVGWEAVVGRKPRQGYSAGRCPRDAATPRRHCRQRRRHRHSLAGGRLRSPIGETSSTAIDSPAIGVRVRPGCQARDPRAGRSRHHSGPHAPKTATARCQVRLGGFMLRPGASLAARPGGAFGPDGSAERPCRGFRPTWLGGRLRVNPQGDASAIISTTTRPWVPGTGGMVSVIRARTRVGLEVEAERRMARWKRLALSGCS